MDYNDSGVCVCVCVYIILEASDRLCSEISCIQLKREHNNVACVNSFFFFSIRVN